MLPTTVARVKILTGQFSGADEGISFDNAYSFAITPSIRQKILSISKQVRSGSLIDSTFMVECDTGILLEDGTINVDFDSNALDDEVEITLCTVGQGWFYIEAILKYNTSLTLKGEAIPLSEII